MGIEYYIACKKCKEYIDLHKAFEFYSVISKDRPPLDDSAGEVLSGGYWESRGLWFLYRHKGHDVAIYSDVKDAWHDIKLRLTEVFPSGQVEWYIGEASVYKYKKDRE